MAQGPFAPRASAASLVTLLSLITGAACQSQRPRDVIESVSETSPPANGGSPSGSPSSDVHLQIFPVGSRAGVVRQLRAIDWNEILVLPGADVERLELWESGGHWHAQTRYSLSGMRVEVTQAEGEGLPPGRLVRVRGEYGIRSQGSFYWNERGFVVAISVAKKSLAARLEWLEFD